jgi:glutamate-1-semialdehyde 2,1-aminomutase
MGDKIFLNLKTPNILDEIQKKYGNRTHESWSLFSEAQKYLPGGTTRDLHFFEPYPIFIERGEGCHVFDVDGNSRIDFFNNATSLILGHCHSSVIKAVSDQVKKGTGFHGPTIHIVELAKLMCERVPSVEKIRFTNSGSEATLLAIQLARAFTGKYKIAKFEGGYHGSHDYANISTHPSLELAGDPNEPRSVPDALGISDDILKSVIVLPYNHINAVEKIVKKHKEDLAGIIVEPMMGAAGVIPAKRDFLLDLRQLTKELNLILIFDEVQTFRFSMGGAQELYNIVPDLTAFGKIIGGGFPVGAVGGKGEIMDLLDSSKGRAKIPHGGTFNGNPITMVAGFATLKELTPVVFKQLSDLGSALRSGLRDIFNRYRIPGQITGEASFFGIHFKDKDSEVTDYRSAVTGINKALRKEMFIYLLNHGIFCASTLRGVLSTPMTMKEVNYFLNSTEEFLKTSVLPFYSERAG